MKKLPIILIVVASLLLLASAFWLGRQTASRSSPDIETIEVRDTVIDTIPYLQPIPVDSTVLRYSTVKLPVKDTIYVKGAETVRIDSVAVEIPITQKEYKDSTYQAWVSGYNANLDSIYVFPKTITITNRIRDAPKRWGLGVQVGVGYNWSHKVQPYIGIGVSYNILTW